MTDQDKIPNVEEPSQEPNEEHTTEPSATQQSSTRQEHVRATATQRMGEEIPTWQPGSQAESEERTVERARSTAEEALEAAQEEAKSALATQKIHAAESLTDVAQAIRRTSDELRQQEHESIARYAERAADRVEGFSDTLRTKPVEDIYSDVQNYAHRQPEVFLGGAFMLGLLAARFLKSSGRASYEQPSTHTSYEGYEERLRSSGYGGPARSQPVSTPYGQRTPTTYSRSSAQVDTQPPDTEPRDE